MPPLTAPPLVLTLGVTLSLATLACEQPSSAAPAPLPSAEQRFPVEIHVPEKLSSVPSDEKDALGRPLRVSCQECHSQRASRTPTATSELDEFHQGLRVQHGELACTSCHDADDPSAKLRLASGETVPMVEALRLCAQCHGPQYRDYRRGSHGGMTGHWDLSRGPRQRNHCIDCHDAHAPAYPTLRPAPPPRDRLGMPPATEPHHE